MTAREKTILVAVVDALRGQPGGQSNLDAYAFSVLDSFGMREYHGSSPARRAALVLENLTEAGL